MNKIFFSDVGFPLEVTVFRWVWPFQSLWLPLERKKAKGIPLSVYPRVEPLHWNVEIGLETCPADSCESHTSHLPIEGSWSPSCFRTVWGPGSLGNWEPSPVTLMPLALSAECSTFRGSRGVLWGQTPVYSLLFFFLFLIPTIVLMHILKGFRLLWIFLLYREDRLV